MKPTIHRTKEAAAVLGLLLFIASGYLIGWVYGP